MSDITYTVTPTEFVSTPDPLAMLPDDERRILIAWRNARTQSKNGIASLFVVKLFSEVLLFIGSNAGKVLLR